MARPRIEPGTWSAPAATLRKSGGWQAIARYRPVHGGDPVRVTATGERKPIAVARLVRKLEALRATDGGGRELTSGATLATAVALYIEELAHERLAPQSRARYARSAQTHVIPALGALTLRELTPAAVASWLHDLAATRLADARTARVVLKAMCSLAIRRGALLRNPVTDAGVRLPASHKAPRALALEELRELQSLLGEYMRGDRPGPRPTTDIPDAIALMLTTGARIGEALGVRAGDLSQDPESGHMLVTVSGTLAYHDGRLVRQDVPKTDAGRRTVEVPDVVGDMLILRARATASPEGLVFTTRKGTPVAPANWRRTFRSVVAGSDLEWVTPHTFRRTAGTAVERAHGVAAASTLLGHTSQAVTEAAYVERRHRSDVASVTERLLQL